MTTIESVTTTPASVSALLAGVLGGDQQPPLTYLRRKSGRGLVAVYGTARQPEHLYTVTVDEGALAGTPTDGTPRWQGEWPGLLADPARGLTVQAFPADRSLPALASAIEPEPDSPLWSALSQAGLQLLPGDGWLLTTVRAIPIRYKPGDRCVIRYRLRLQRPVASGSEQRWVSVVGKLYREPEQAAAAEALQERLSSSSARRWCAAPAGCVESSGLLLSEDLGDSTGDSPTQPGTEVVRPGGTHAVDTIRAAGHAVADLHTSGTLEANTPRRSGPDEAVKARKRAAALAGYLPQLAPSIAAAAGRVCDRLTTLAPETERPAHGSFKPSQLLVRGGSVFLVDLDQFCRADPALDVGYFLAYLRPPGLFYHRAGCRSWFEAASRGFQTAYQAALTGRGVSGAEAEAILQRSAVYEAALLFKIAARRQNRLQSPRPTEVRAVLHEIERCLDR